MGQNTCNFITEFGVIFIFAKIEGCGQKNIREIKILFDNSLIVYFGSYISGLVLGFITSIWSSPITGVLHFILQNKIVSLFPIEFEAFHEYFFGHTRQF